jgi:uncharacterized protein YjbI with pentapeptide repeats
MADQQPGPKQSGPKRSFLWETLRQEWRIWLAVAILLIGLGLFSDPLADLLQKSSLIKVLDSLGKLGLLVAVIAFLREIPRWEERAAEAAKQRQFEYWKAIDAARTTERNPDGRLFSGALKLALEGLAQERDLAGKPIKISTVAANGVNLEGIDLEGAHLHVCGFNLAELSQANFRHTILNYVRFDRARLFGADFRGARFEEVRFMYALYDEVAEQQFPDGFDLLAAGAYKIAPGVSLPGALLENASLWDAQLAGANLAGANLENAILGGSNLQDANLQNANLRGARARGVNLRGAELRNANFTEAKVEAADFRGAKNLTVLQIQAARDWHLAIYDTSFSQALGL